MSDHLKKSNRPVSPKGSPSEVNVTLKPMMKTLRVSSTVRHTSVDTLASSMDWSVSPWEYTRNMSKTHAYTQSNSNQGGSAMSS